MGYPSDSGAVPKCQTSTHASITPKADRSLLLTKFKEEESADDNIENELDMKSFKLTDSPVRKSRDVDFIHSPFQIIKNGKKPVLKDSHTANQANSEANRQASGPSSSFRSRTTSSGRSRSRTSSSSSSSGSNISNSPKTHSANALNNFRNITPLNFEDAVRMQSDDTPVSRRAVGGKSVRTAEFEFKKPIAHQRIRSIEEKAPVLLQQHKTPSSSRSTSPVKQVASKSSQSVSLTPAQRVEKHSGRLFNNSNSAMDGKSALDSYEFKELLGKGASASVYKAVNLITGAEVAIKQIEINTKEDIELMMTEIRLLKILKHKNIVKYHGYVNNGQSLNIMLEYCSGGSLRKAYKLRRKGLEEQQIIRYTREILHGLVYLHEQGVIHRDVKAANVLLTGDGTVKLADFGVSSRANHKSSLVVGGSPYWMAPEVILLQGSTTASDIWSLGATVVELFTTQPPYHEFDPMAACHAIGTEDDPPIPADIPKLATDFLVQCFQKSPEIRIDAKRLLQHPWLNEGSKLRSASSNKNLDVVVGDNFQQMLSPPFHENTSQRFAMTPKNQDKNQVLAPKLRNKKISLENKEGLIGATSPFRDLDETIDETDFVEVDFKSKTPNLSRVAAKEAHVEILTKYNEENELNDEEDNIFIETKIDRLQIVHKEPNFDVEEDPFMEMDLQDDVFVDPKETRLISSVERLIEKLNDKNDQLVADMTQLVEILEANHTMCKVLIRNHGLIRLLELLDSNLAEVNNYCLQILNLVFASNPQSLENVCIIGGITAIMEFSNFKYPLKVRLRVVEFIDRIVTSTEPRVLQMFVACGGLKILTRFVEEDVDANPEFVLCGIDGIYAVFTSELPTSRSDFCYLLKDSVDWLAVAFNRLVTDDPDYADKIVTVLQSFSYSEQRVKNYIATTTLFKSIFKNFRHLSSSNKLKILKFISSLSSVSANLNILDASNCLSFLTVELIQNAPPAPNFKEIANAICPIIFNLCHLNKIRQLELVELDAVPILAKLAAIELPFKDFIIPILSELVLINSRIRSVLWANNVFKIFTGYLTNPYWQVNSLDAIKNWLTLDTGIEQELTRNTSRFIEGFEISSNLSYLQIFLELIGWSTTVCRMFARPQFVETIFRKLQQFNKNAIIELTLLKILKKIISDNKGDRALLAKVQKSTQKLTIDNRSVLVMELMKEIADLFQT